MRRRSTRTPRQQPLRAAGSKRKREEEEEEEGEEEKGQQPAAAAAASNSASVSSSRHRSAAPLRAALSSRTRSQMRRTRSSGSAPLLQEAGQREAERREAEHRKAAARSSRRQRRRSSASASASPPAAPHLRRMRRAPLSLLPAPPASLRALLPALLCPVCGQLLVRAVCLPCSHCACEFCLHSHLQLKAAACPLCSAPVDDEQRAHGRHALPVAALDSAAEAVAARVLDAKGAAARRRRQRLDAADMRRVRAGWKRRQGAEQRRERRQREQQMLSQEMRLFHRRMRPHAFADSRASDSEQRDNDDEDEDDDDDFVPASELESDDSVGAVQLRAGQDSAEGESAGSGSSSSGGSGSSGESPSASSASSCSSPSICSSEEDSVELERGLILPSPRHRRPQRTQYTAMRAVQRSPRARRLLCKHCQQAADTGALLIRIQHGDTTQWSHPLCLSSSITGRTLPLSRIEGVARLTRQERLAVSEAWTARDEQQPGDSSGAQPS